MQGCHQQPSGLRFHLLAILILVIYKSLIVVEVVVDTWIAIGTHAI